MYFIDYKGKKYPARDIDNVPGYEDEGTVTVAEGAVSQSYRQTATNGALPFLGLLFHPLQCSAALLVGGNALGLRGKSRAPHLGQHIQVAGLCRRQ